MKERMNSQKKMANIEKIGGDHVDACLPTVIELNYNYIQDNRL